MLTLIDGTASTHLPCDDRGLAYGHGVFETLPLIAGEPRLWQAHMARLERGCERLGIPFDGVESAFAADLKQIAGGERAILKLMVTCGSGGRGYLPPEAVSVRRIVQCLPWPDYPSTLAEEGICAHLCFTRLALNPYLAGLKHLNRLEQVLARREWRNPDIREGIVQSLGGYVVEGTMSNLFWVSRGQVYTPDLSECGVEGVMRNHLLDRLRELSVPVSLGYYDLDALLDADEVFFCNSLIGIWPLRALGEHQFQPGPVTRQLQAYLQQSYFTC